jgi:hypothetical protein
MTDAEAAPPDGVENGPKSEVAGGRDTHSLPERRSRVGPYDKGFPVFLSDPTRHADPHIVDIVFEVMPQLCRWRGQSPNKIAEWDEAERTHIVPPGWFRWNFKSVRADVTAMLTGEPPRPPIADRRAYKGVPCEPEHETTPPNLPDAPECFQMLERFHDAMLKLETEWRAENLAAEGGARKLEMDEAAVESISWKHPSPVSQCEFVGKTGRQCARAPVPGATRCPGHGGALVNEDTRRALLLTSYLKLVEATDVAVDALVDVAANSRNDLARVQASKEILDRAGLTSEVQISVRLDDDGSTGRLSALRTRLDTLGGVLNRNVSDATLQGNLPGHHPSPSPAPPGPVVIDAVSHPASTNSATDSDTDDMT